MTTDHAAWIRRLQAIEDQHANDATAEFAANLVAIADRAIARAIREHMAGGQTLREQGYIWIADALGW